MWEGVTFRAFSEVDDSARSLDHLPLAAALAFDLAFSAKSFCRLTVGESISIVFSSSNTLASTLYVALVLVLLHVEVISVDVGSRSLVRGSGLSVACVLVVAIAVLLDFEVALLGSDISPPVSVFGSAGACFSVVFVILAPVVVLPLLSSEVSIRGFEVALLGFGDSPVAGLLAPVGSFFSGYSICMAPVVLTFLGTEVLPATRYLVSAGMFVSAPFAHLPPIAVFALLNTEVSSLLGLLVVGSFVSAGLALVVMSPLLGSGVPSALGSLFFAGFFVSSGALGRIGPLVSAGSLGSAAMFPLLGSGVPPASDSFFAAWSFFLASSPGNVDPLGSVGSLFSVGSLVSLLLVTPILLVAKLLGTCPSLCPTSVLCIGSPELSIPTDFDSACELINLSGGRRGRRMRV